MKFHPVIQFTTEGGESVTFRSEWGESHAILKRWDGSHKEPVSRYSLGQQLDVFYDPAGALRPCLATWIGIFGPFAALTAGGVGFLGGAALMWFAFREKLLGH